MMFIFAKMMSMKILVEISMYESHSASFGV
jgi:hypothetical protein